jgi:G6PDH family F420-dependent oxidoreductase
VIAHAAATSAVLLDGRFCLGLGSGEALNEHILGDRWPPADERLEMLEEAVEVIRLLWRGGFRDHHGRHYRVENARIYDLPDEPPPILISGFGPKSIDLAARIGDGFCTVQPDPDAVSRFRSRSGEGKLVQGGTKVCWGEDEKAALATAHRLWPNEALPGELAQVLPTTRHFEQASDLVAPEQIAEQVPCGPDLERHLETINAFAEAGFDELYIQQIGPDQDAFFAAYQEHVLPRVRELATARKRPLAAEIVFLFARAFEVSLAAFSGASVVGLVLGVLNRPPGRVLIAVGGVLDQFLLGQFKALGLALARLDQRPLRIIGLLGARLLRARPAADRSRLRRGAVRFPRDDVLVGLVRVAGGCAGAFFARRVESRFGVGHFARCYPRPMSEKPPEAGGPNGQRADRVSRKCTLTPDRLTRVDSLVRSLTASRASSPFAPSTPGNHHVPNGRAPSAASAHPRQAWAGARGAVEAL